MKMEIYKYLRNECMDIKRSVCAGGAFLCTRRRGSFQLSFFVKKIKYMNQDNVYKNKVNIVNTVGKTWFVKCYKINSLW